MPVCYFYITRMKEMVNSLVVIWSYEVVKCSAHVKFASLREENELMPSITSIPISDKTNDLKKH